MRVLFVCLGNICRSPTAEGVLRHKLVVAGLQDLVTVDSAGTSDWHVGKPVDARTRQAAQRRGLQHLQSLQTSAGIAQLDLFLYRYGLPITEVPDPYYSGEEGFEQVLDLLEQACDGLVADLKERL
jgi:protein-tyrosine phosphatase